MRKRYIILDDLHGSVALEQPEWDLVNTRWFQRLRRIHQLGLASMVFPGAEQTRFAHSVGVFHLASRLGPRLREEDHISEQDEKELRAAALLHDIGHFPFSHTIESVYEDLAGKSPTQYLKAETLTEMEDTGPGTTSASHCQFHEDFGRRILADADDDNSPGKVLRSCDLDPQRLGAIIVGAHENVLLNQIVHSDLDVDQLDYLLRDAKATGSAYGLYDLNYLMECIDVVYWGGAPQLCVRFQGLHPLEHYVLSKYFYYVCILYQKTRCALEGLLQALAVNLISAGRLPSWSDVETQLADGSLWEFDDVAVLAAIREVAGDNTAGAQVRDAAHMLLERRVLKVDAEEHRPDSGAPYGPVLEPGIDWNPILKKAARRAGLQSFTVLKEKLRDPEEAGASKQAQLEVELRTDGTPIRLLVEPPYAIPPDTPSVPATDRSGEVAGRLVLLESLGDTVVGRLAGHTTYISRLYRPA